MDNLEKPVTATVEIAKNGPYVVSGALPLGTQIIGANENGDSVAWKQGEKFPTQAKYALCRCGQSASKPFCDGSHARVGFDRTETASRQSYLEQAKVIKGPVLSLMDVESLCAFARFCDPNGQVWNLVRETDQPAASQHFVAQTCECPSGRLVAWDNQTQQAIEPKYEGLGQFDRGSI